MIDSIGSLSANFDAPAVLHARAAGAGRAAGPSFSAMLADQLRRVETLQQGAEQAAAALANGSTRDITGVLDAARQAEDAFRLLLQVRGRVLEAYEEVKQIRF